jgi:transcriptional regulator with PAS, ATPase and Fis domain
VRLNCAALPESLADAELFGHEKGAFTGATSRKIGYLEAANGGTLMLDEIGELALPLQAKLLRVLESRRLSRVGSTQEIPVDVRLASATCRDLTKAVASGAFRKDLYFRISAFCLEVPPLRERPLEIALLAELFATQLSRRSGGASKSFAPDALDALARYDWPGNIRELRNAVEHALVLAEQDTIARDHLPRTIYGQRAEEPARADAEVPMPSRVAEVERETIVEALRACGGNRTNAALRLGISRRALVYKLAKYGIR